jgi:predicted amidohydrolase
VKHFVVAAAQSESKRGDIAANIGEHLRLVDRAASLGVHLIVFPELSLIGYELDLGHALQLEPEDPLLAPIRDAASRHRMHILVGGPRTSGLDRPFLSAFLISPDTTTCYDKIYVHESERAFFAPGDTTCVVNIRGVRTAIAICADTSHPAHAVEAAQHDARLYVASVMKALDEYPTHADRMAGYAARHGMAVLTANHAGSTGGQRSAGSSAIWDERGQLVARAGPEGRALVIGRRIAGRWGGEVLADTG